MLCELVRLIAKMATEAGRFQCDDRFPLMVLLEMAGDPSKCSGGVQGGMLLLGADACAETGPTGLCGRTGEAQHSRNWRVWHASLAFAGGFGLRLSMLECMRWGTAARNRQPLRQVLDPPAAACGTAWWPRRGCGPTPPAL